MAFLVLPDREGARALLGDAAPAGARTVDHVSGRPWLVGDWAPDECTVVTAGTRRLVLLGAVRVDVTAAERALARAAAPHALDGFAASLPGCFHLAASFDGRCRVQGSLSTARHVFHTDVAGLTVAADAPHPLAALLGRGPDADVLAARLLTPLAPWPLSEDCVWPGVRALPLGSWLGLGPDGRHRIHRWWRAPEPHLPPHQAAVRVRQALRACVETRTRGRDTVSADLSGGMDSTTLCFLAGATGTRLVTHHWLPLDAANDDDRWAVRAAALLPGAAHLRLAPDEGPAWLEPLPGQYGPEDVLEGPLPWHRNRSRMEHTARRVAAEGSRLHLTGLGGDELFSPTPTYLWSLVRRRPVRGVATAARARALNRWHLRDTVRALADGRSFARTLTQMAARLQAPAPGPHEPPMGWSGHPRMPAWVTPGAADAVRGRLLRAAAGAEPLHPDRLQHQVLESVLLSGGALRQMRPAMRRADVSWEAPFLDDRVVEAALAVRIEDRAARDRYKPVLTAAMRPDVPAELLGRRTKGEFSAEIYAGLHGGRGALLELCDDLRLARLGLVDADALRRALLAPKPETRHLSPLINTLACEAWLRSPSADRPRRQPAGDPR
ncbi:asparagine synthase-related protein [Streptomyces ziwulingensis]|uniref:Lasso peptide isopeptide bond-forming cyclase n=1 Tax=Streptomyces ziwulingensis TaxID=1045501 RepID=A0ABP9BTJ0_9ACTN